MKKILTERIPYGYISLPLSQFIGKGAFNFNDTANYEYTEFIDNRIYAIDRILEETESINMKYDILLYGELCIKNPLIIRGNNSEEEALYVKRKILFNDYNLEQELNFKDIKNIEIHLDVLHTEIFRLDFGHFPANPKQLFNVPSLIKLLD